MSSATMVRRQAQRTELVLRLGAGLCFIGHGVFGLMRKPEWLQYFAFAGIDPTAANLLMPVVGTVDILVGVAVLVRPQAALLSYMVFWALWTAALRPLTGEPVWELLERAGNYGVPLGMLFLAGATRVTGPRAPGRRAIGPRVTEWFRNTAGPSMHPDPTAVRRTELVLRASIALLMTGHGFLALSGKQLLVEHAALLGLDVAALRMIGVVEIALGLAAAVRPATSLLGGIVVWKLFTEFLYPVSGQPVWEFVERAGSYAAPLALLFLKYRLMPAMASDRNARSEGSVPVHNFTPAREVTT